MGVYVSLYWVSQLSNAEKAEVLVWFGPVSMLASGLTSLGLVVGTTAIAAGEHLAAFVCLAQIPQSVCPYACCSLVSCCCVSCRYKEVVETVLRYKDSKEKLIRWVTVGWVV
jgi:hypothetical protein